MTATLWNVLRCLPLDFVNPFNVWVPVVLGCAPLLLLDMAALVLCVPRARRTRGWRVLMGGAGVTCLGAVAGGLWIWRRSQNFIGCSVVELPEMQRQPAESALTQGMAAVCLVATLVLVQLGMTHLWRARRGS